MTKEIHAAIIKLALSFLARSLFQQKQLPDYVTLENIKWCIENVDYPENK